MHHKFQQEIIQQKIQSSMHTVYEISPNFNESHSINKNQYDTPQKSIYEETAQKTLMKNIMERISSAKQSGKSKNLQSLKKLNAKEASKSSKSQNNDDQMNQDKQLVLKNQSPNNPGFYEYVHWLKLHAQAFSYIEQKKVEEFWKILRLINYGEVLIPTGLIYEIVIQTKQNDTIGGFEKVINRFLAENQTPDRIKNFKQIKNYSSLQDIEKQYKCVKQRKFQIDKKKKQFVSSSKPSRSNSTSNVFERNFEEARTRQAKKITQVCQGIIKQQRKCYQKPKISVYKSQSFQSLIKPVRICQHASQHKWKSEQDKYLQDSNNVLQNIFRAKILDKSVFEGNIEQIPGVASHLSRNHYSQAERLRLKREAEKPQYSKKRVQ